ncbi:MAG: acyl-CoA thioesterase [Bacillota bacterium]|nr:acyl-CoA thioesterase [Bacillota bacterium]
MKTREDSYTEQVQILSLRALNGNNRLFGGQLMSWIDVVAAVVARRHSGKYVTTAVVDTLSFKEPAYANDIVVLQAYITYTGRTSMEICVKCFVENLDGTRKLINKAYVVMVALDENDRPTPVVPLVPITDEEKEEWARAEKRNQLRKQRRNEDF